MHASPLFVLAVLIAISQPKVVACKQFLSDNPAEGFDEEVKNLDAINQCLNRQDNVLQHLAALQHGQTLLILFPYAPHFNLEVFLREGLEPQISTAAAVKRYDFSEKFPFLLDPEQRHRANVKQAYDLAGALLWLHEEIRIFDLSEQDPYLAHLDLKPENILIDGFPQDPRSPAGAWKLSDFGISAFNKATNESARDVATIGDYTQRLTSRGVSNQRRRGHGPYQPPEVGLERMLESSPTNIMQPRNPLDGRKCDAWSFGGVLADLLSFALEGATGYERLRNYKRMDSRDDNFYISQNIPLESNAEITVANTWVKPRIANWWSDIRSTQWAPWVEPYVQILEKVIKPRPIERANSRSIVERLGQLNSFFVPAATEDLLPIPNTNPNGLLQVPGPDNILNQQMVGAQIDGQGSVSSTHSDPPWSQRVDSVSSNLATHASTNSSSAIHHTQSDSEPTMTVPAHPVLAPVPLPEMSTMRFTACNDAVPSITTAACSAVALDPTGSLVAVLNGNEVRVMSTREDDDNNNDRTRTLSAGVTWSILQLTRSYLAAYGNKSDGSKYVSP